MTDDHATRNVFESPFVEALYDLTVAELRRVHEWGFLESMAGATFRAALDPKGQTWYLVVNGRDAPARFSEAVVKGAVEAARRRLRN